MAFEGKRGEQQERLEDAILFTSRGEYISQSLLGDIKVLCSVFCLCKM